MKKLVLQNPRSGIKSAYIIRDGGYKGGNGQGHLYPINLVVQYPAHHWSTHHRRVRDAKSYYTTHHQQPSCGHERPVWIEEVVEVAK